MTKRPKCRWCKKPLPAWTRTESTRVAIPNECASIVEGKPVFDHHLVEHEVHEGWGMAGDGLFCSVEHGYAYARSVIEKRRRSNPKPKRTP